MSARFTCAQGHEWEASDEPDGTLPACPVCASQGHTPPLPPPADPYATALPVPSDGAAATGGLVPGYEILDELGRGGMGVVYRARQLKLNRLVALKMILAGGHGGAEARTRFETEAHAVARLRHPGIVQIYEFGEAGGLPFFSLEYVDGGSLQQTLAGKPLPPQQAAVLAEQMARAMQYAHEQGVVHRDLKPANVLLHKGAGDEGRLGRTTALPSGKDTALTLPAGEGSAAGVPKITDFGLAKMLDDDSRQTRSGAVLGTPCYMAPEQALGHTGEVGPATDVYALGAILYEMLTGRPPFLGVTVMETLEQVVGRDPLPPRRLQPLVSPDLETICLKCLRKEPEKRYASAADLADDLRRYLDGEPIVARPISPLARAVKWARRRPGIAGLAALLLLVALTGLTLVLWQWRRAEALAVAEGKAKDNALAAWEQTEQAHQQEKEHRQVAETARDEAEKQLYLSNIALAHREWLASNPNRALELLNECPPGRRRWEWHYLKGLHAAGLLRLRPHGPGLIGSVAFSPCGKFLASADRIGDVAVCDAVTGEEQMRLTAGGHQVLALAYSTDGQVLATAGRDGCVRLWNARTGEPGAVLRGHKGAVPCLALSAAGRLASGGEDGTVVLWDLASGRRFKTLRGHTGPVKCLAFSRCGKLLASGSANPDTTVRVWEAHSGNPVVTLPPFFVAITAVAFSPNGKRLAVANGVGKQVALYEPATGKALLWTSFPGADMINAIAFSPDSKRIAVACQSPHVAVYDFQKMTSENYHGNAGSVLSVAFSPDGSRLASGSIGGEVRVWDAHDPPGMTTWKARRIAGRLAFSPDGAVMALAMGSALVGLDLQLKGLADVHLVDTATGKVLRELTGPRAWIASLAFAPDGRRLAALWRDRSITVWETSSGRALWRGKGAGGGVAFPEQMQVGFSADGKEVLAGSDVLQAWEAGTGRELRRLPLEGITGSLWSFAFSPGCKRFVSATLQGTVQFWDPASGREVARLAGPWSPTAMAFTRTGGQLAIASGGGMADTRLALYDVASRKEVRSFAGQGGETWLAFSADGTRLASGGKSDAVRVWDVAAGRELLSLDGHAYWARSGAFSPDGLTLASSDGEATIRLWSGRPQRELFALGEGGRLSLGLAYAPDGKRLAATVAGGAAAVLWDATTGRRQFAVGEIEGNQVGMSLAFRPDATELAIGKGNRDTGEIEVWDLVARTRRWRLSGHTRSPMSLAYSPDGKRLASGSHDRTARVWDLITSKCLRTFRGHRSLVHGVAYSPDGKRIASTGGEGLVRVWDPETGEEVLCLHGPRGAPGTLLLTPDPWSFLLNLRVQMASLGAVAYSPDGKFLAACSLGQLPMNNAVIVWDARTGKEVRTMRGHTGWIYQVVYRPDGKVLASAGRDRTVRLWDAKTGKELLTLTGHDALVFRLAYSPDGKRLASASPDGTVRV